MTRHARSQASPALPRSRAPAPASRSRARSLGRRSAARRAGRRLLPSWWIRLPRTRETLFRAAGLAPSRNPYRRRLGSGTSLPRRAGACDDQRGEMSAAYDDWRAAHRWEVPERYNIAADVCDKHPREKPAMVWESFDGARRELTWGELQDLANQAAHVLAARGVERGDRVAVVLPPTPETAAIFFGVWKLGAILLSMSVLYGDDGIRHRLDDSGARLLVTDAANAPRFDHDWAPTCSCSTRSTLAARADRPRLRRHGGRRPGAALLHLRHDRAREGDRARAPLPARARGVRLLPRGRGRRALPRDGRVGVGGGDRAAARAVAARRGAVRLPARGRLRPAQAARLPQPPRGDERLHDADGDALDDGDRGRRHALPAARSAASARRASR